MIRAISIATASALICGFAALETARADDVPSFVTYDFYPFGRAREGKLTGLFPDLMSEVERLADVTVEKHIEPISRALKSISQGENDLIISGALSPAFKETISLGILGCNRTIVVANRDTRLSKLEDLKDRRIGFVVGGFLLRKYGNKFGIQPIQTRSSESMFGMLTRRRLDGIFISDIVFASYGIEGAPFKSLPEDWRSRIGSVLEVDKIKVHFRMLKSSKFRHLEPTLRAAIKTGSANGAFERVYQKYGAAKGGRC